MPSNPDAKPSPKSGDPAADLAFEALQRGRLDILEALIEPMRYSDLARSLAVSEGELSRNLKRLTDARLLDRGADGRFSLTPLARSTLVFAPGLRMLQGQADFFAEHRLDELPEDLVRDCGALAGARLLDDPFKMFGAIGEVFDGVRTFFWGQWIIQRQVFSPEEIAGQQILADRVRANKADARGVLLAEELPLLKHLPGGFEGLVKVRTVAAAPTSLAMSDAGAFLQFNDRSGRIDFNYAFWGSDPAYMAWCRRLFLHFWDIATPVAEAGGFSERGPTRGR